MGLTPHKEAIKFPTEDELLSCTTFLEKNPHSVQKWINLADKYMQTFAKDPETFLLPKTHEFLKPLIVTYARNADGFVQYLIGLRDTFSKEDLAWDQVQTIHRRVNGRYIQQQRRERSNRATQKAEELYGPTDYHSRLKWVSDLEHTWASRRLLFMDKHRDAQRAERLDTETRADLLLEFWEIIDTEIHEGNIPSWS